MRPKKKKKKITDDTAHDFASGTTMALLSVTHVVPSE